MGFRYCLLFVAVVLVACSRQGQGQEERQGAAVSLATVISRQSRLYTTEYVVHKIVTHNDLKSVQGSFLGVRFSRQLPLGDRKIAIPIDVTLQAYVDFSLVGEEDIEVAGDALRISLPDPQIVVISSKVDNEGVRSHVSWLRSDFGDAELNDFAQQGVASVLGAAEQMGIVESARQNAAALLIPLLADMGYGEERIVVTFRKDFGEGKVKMERWKD